MDEKGTAPRRVVEEQQEAAVKEVIGEEVEEELIKNVERQYYPRKVENPFKRRELSFWQKLGKFLTFGLYNPQGELIMYPDLKQPLLFLMNDNGYTDILEGVNMGLFIKEDKNTGKQKGIYLSQRKLTTLNIEPYYKVFIAYENEMTPYPADVMHDAEEFVTITRKMMANQNLLKDEAKLVSAKMMFWGVILGIILLGIYLGFQQGWFKSIFGG